MTNSITPPPELMRLWLDNDNFPFETGTNDLLSITRDRLNSVINQCAAWAADTELEACVELTRDNDGYDAALGLRAARRPKPPSLKEQALEALETLNQAWTMPKELEAVIAIRRALESLDD